MKILNCPVNGPRPIQEFQFGGDVRSMPDPDRAGDQQWADYVFYCHGEPAIKRQWWCHIPSSTWFIAERDTRTDQIVRTYLHGSREQP